MQKPCKGRENENACRTRPSLEGGKQDRRQGVKKNDTVEKRMTPKRRCKVHGARDKEEEKPGFESGQEQDLNEWGENKRGNDS